MKYLLTLILLVSSLISFAQPKITGFSPTSAPNGGTVKISGLNLNGTISVSFGGVPVSYIQDSINGTFIYANIGQVGSGFIVVKTINGIDSVPGFEYTSPKITGFTPTSGTAGTAIKITGDKLSGASKVSIGGVDVKSFTVDSTGSIAAIAGPGATGEISVTTTGGTGTSGNRFEYTGPIIYSVYPKIGTAGTIVNIIGANLTGTSTINFGTDTAKSFVVNSPGQITAILGTGGNGSVKVITPNGSATADSFVYKVKLVPAIKSFTPASGVNGTSVVITGTDLWGISAVSFGGIPAASFFTDTLKGASITAVVGEGASGLVKIVSAYGNDSLGGFVYTAPRVFSFTPSTGTNGTTIKITGENFTGATQVRFGNGIAKSFTIDSAKGITAIVGNGATGNVYVTGALPAGVTSNTNTATGTSSAIFTYNGPTITKVDPMMGTVGTTVKITGDGFSGTTAVKFGGTAARSFTVDSVGNITAVVGSGTTGNIAVTTPAGTTSIDGFVFGNPPTVTSFSPTSGKNGTSVTITGTNFIGATNILFGGTKAASFQVASPTTIVAVVGTGATGSLTVTTPFGSASLTGFTHIGPSITGFTPKTGVKGTKITIIGNNFTSASTVSFGGTAALTFTVDSAKGISAIVNTGSSGNVSVTTPNGTITQAGFIYAGPSISSFTPKTGTVGTSVRITGSNLSGTTAVTFGDVNAKSFTIDSAGITAIVANGSLSGAVGIINPNGNASSPGFIFLSPPPTISYSGATSFCSGGSLLLTSSADINNQWYKNGVALPTDTAKSYAVTTSGYYSLAYKINGVMSAISSNIIVTVNTSPKAAFTIKTPVQCFKGNLFSFTNSSNNGTGNAPSASGLQYAWNFGDTGVSSKFDPSYQYSTAGSYIIKLVVTNASGCKDSTTAVAKVNPSPTVNNPILKEFKKDSLICFFDSLVISSNDVYDRYLWSTGDSSASILLKKSALVYLKIGTKDPTCYSDSSVMIDARKNTTPVPTITRTADNLISSIAGSYKWSLGNKVIAGETTNSLAIHTKGIYNVSTSNDKVCWTNSADYIIITDPVATKRTYSITIYPNPSNGIFSVQAKFDKTTSAVINVTLSSSSGVIKFTLKRLIFSDKTIKIPVSLNLQKGIYTLKVDVNGEINTQQIVIL
jgi:hypothetical protein